MQAWCKGRIFDDRCASKNPTALCHFSALYGLSSDTAMTSSQFSEEIARYNAFVPLEVFLNPKLLLIGLKKVDIVDAVDRVRDMFITLEEVLCCSLLSASKGIIAR